MTKFETKTLLDFVTRTGMYIHPQDENNFVSFIHGFECGTKNKFDFSRLSKELLSGKYKIEYLSDGWPGQIKRLSDRLSISWTITFKKILLEIIANESSSLDNEIVQIIKTRVRELIARISINGHPSFNQSWKDEWLSLCSTKSTWFKQLWTDSELKIIKAIDNQIKTGNIYASNSSSPSSQLLRLKDQYDRSTMKNGT